MVHKISTNAIYITGLSHTYPPYSLDAQAFTSLIAQLYPNYSTSPGLQKLVQFNNKTQIHRRHTVLDFTKATERNSEPPAVDELSRMFREHGVELAASACIKAMQEAKVSSKDITHVVAVTCTDQSNPGYDLLVCQKLGLDRSVQRTLLHGVGCAGGLSALRSAGDIAAAESRRERRACVLVIACELCSLFFKAELQAASRDDALHIAPALFSDAAAALVVINELAVREDRMPVYELREWRSMVVPDTVEHMSYAITADGMIASITADVPRTAVSAISPLFEQLCDSAVNPHKSISHETNHPPAEFDWAIHPGGAAILRGAQRSLNLVDDHIRASLNVYRSHGNSSSPTVLIVLDELRRMGKGRDNVVATSFGPGLTIEMCMMKRCRSTAVTPRLTSSFWNSKQLSRLSLFRVARSVISKQRCSWITSTRAP